MLLLCFGQIRCNYISSYTFSTNNGEALFFSICNEVLHQDYLVFFSSSTKTSTNFFVAAILIVFFVQLIPYWFLFEVVMFFLDSQSIA